MRRFLLIVTAMMLVLLLAACGTSRPGAEASGSTANALSAYTVEEVWFERDGMRIYGELYLPEGGGQHPLVILSHGFGGNHSYTEGYARVFAENGIAAYAFDFVGGGRGSKSDGKITEMSVLTEAADLNAVIDGLLGRGDIDSSELYLLGGSQGGFVSTYVAGTRPKNIKGLIALYPAYVLQDDAWERTPDPENIPETMNLMGTTIGRIYNEDAMSFDIYDVMKEYPGDVLIIHGTRDSIAPIRYSERAVTVFPSAELIRFDGAGHGFYGSDETRSAELAVDFVRKHLGAQDGIVSETEGTQEMKMIIGDTPVSVSWEENPAVEELKRMAAASPITVEMTMYGGFEQVGSLGANLPRDDVQTVTEAGDIVLYAGNQIVIFYGSNSWAYTRLGKIVGLSDQELIELLGKKDVTISLFLN